MNYWGYNPLAFSAPHSRATRRATASAPPCRRVPTRWCVRCTPPGIEVILDVVYNHTAESGADGPTLSLRGVDNASLLPARSRAIRAATSRRDRVWQRVAHGPAHRSGRRLVFDSLRWWARVMRIDGFRFDLASALARDRRTARCEIEGFFERDRPPIRSWAGSSSSPSRGMPTADGYALGRLPRTASRSGTDEFRDTVRRFWRGDDAAQLGDAGVAALAGSSDVFDATGPRLASVNFVSCHDGFTLRDVVSYSNASTTRPTASRTATAPTATGATTGARRDRPRRPTSSGSADASAAASSRRSPSRRAFR